MTITITHGNLLETLKKALELGLLLPMVLGITKEKESILFIHALFITYAIVKVVKFKKHIVIDDEKLLQSTDTSILLEAVKNIQMHSGGGHNNNQIGGGFRDNYINKTFVFSIIIWLSTTAIFLGSGYMVQQYVYWGGCRQGVGRFANIDIKKYLSNIPFGLDTWTSQIIESVLSLNTIEELLKHFVDSKIDLCIMPKLLYQSLYSAAIFGSPTLTALMNVPNVLSFIKSQVRRIIKELKEDLQNIKVDEQKVSFTSRRRQSIPTHTTTTPQKRRKTTTPQKRRKTTTPQKRRKTTPTELQHKQIELTQLLSIRGRKNKDQREKIGQLRHEISKIEGDILIRETGME